MWWVMLLLATTPAMAQRPFCDFGSALGALRDADAAMAAPVQGLVEGRERAGRAAELLDGAGATLIGCGCPDAAARASEATRLAEEARLGASAAGIGAAFVQARMRIGWTQQALGTRGCR